MTYCLDMKRPNKVAPFYLPAMVERTGIEPVTPTMST